MKYQNILITGGAGYVGSMLCENLLKKNYNVKVYDTCYFGTDHLPLENNNFKLIKEDIRNTPAFFDSCNNIDVVIHLACISKDRKSVV